MTKYEAFVKVTEILRNANEVELADIVDKEVAILEKRSAKQKANAQKKKEQDIPLMDKILEVIGSSDELLKTGEIATSIGISTPKACALLRRLTTDGSVIRVEETKKKVVYKLAD